MEEDAVDAFLNELEYQKQVQPNATGAAALQWAHDQMARYRTALQCIADENIIQGMSPALFARSIITGP